jgi:hypothetical protein
VNLRKITELKSVPTKVNSSISNTNHRSYTIKANEVTYFHGLETSTNFDGANFFLHGGAIAQTVSRWLPTAAAKVQTRAQSCRICGWQSGAGAGFLRVLRFPLQIFIPSISPQSPSLIVRGWYNRPVVAAVPKVPPH